MPQNQSAKAKDKQKILKAESNTEISIHYMPRNMNDG